MTRAATEPVDFVAPLTACAAVADAVEDEDDDDAAALACTGGAEAVGAALAIGFPFASTDGDAAAPAPRMLESVEFEAPNADGSVEDEDDDESLDDDDESVEHMFIVSDHPPDGVDHCIPASSHPYGHSQSQETDSSPIPYWYDCCHEDMSVPDIIAVQEVDEAVEAEAVVDAVELLIAVDWKVENDFAAVGLIANTIP